jgi:hypothetical protein
VTAALIAGFVMLSVVLMVLWVWLVEYRGTGDDEPEAG